MSLLKTALQRAVISADGPSSQSAPISIPARATSAQDTKDEPPSPTASISGDKYILVRAPKPTVRSSQLADAVVKADIVKSVSALSDLKSEPCTTLSKERMQSLLSEHATNGVVKIRLWIAYQTSSAAATPQAPVTAVDPSVATEFASLANLFSEFRVMPDAGVRYLLSWSGAPNTQIMATAYDPSLGTQLTSTLNGFESKQHQGLGFGPDGTVAPQSKNG